MVVNTCGFIDAAVDESLEAIGEALAENGKVIVTGCLGAQPQKILDRHPQVLKITGPHATKRWSRRCTSICRRRTSPFLDLIPAAGREAHAAPLRLPEDLRGLQSSLQLLHHPLDARRPLQPADRRGDARGGALVRAGVREILVISQDTSAYGVGSEVRGQTLARRPSAAPLPRSGRALWATSACGCGCIMSIPIRTSMRWSS